MLPPEADSKVENLEQLKGTFLSLPYVRDQRNHVPSPSGEHTGDGWDGDSSVKPPDRIPNGKL